MKIRPIIILCAGSLAASAAELGPYTFGDLGLNIASDVEASVKNPAGRVEEGDLEFDPGFRLGVGIGNHFSRWLSAELESGFLYSPLTDSNSWMGHLPLLGNIVFRYESPSGWVPYAGGGVGAALTFLNLDEPGLDDDDSDLVLAWQGLVGIRYRASERLSVGIGYKYFATEGSNFSILLSKAEVRETASHAFGITFKLDF